MPTANIKARKNEAGNLFPRTDARVEAGGMRRPPVDRMLRADRHITKQELRELAARPEHVRD